jgi:hypothetical protein
LHTRLISKTKGYPLRQPQACWFCRIQLVHSVHPRLARIVHRQDLPRENDALLTLLCQFRSRIRISHHRLCLGLSVDNPDSHDSVDRKNAIDGYVAELKPACLSKTLFGFHPLGASDLSSYCHIPCFSWHNARVPLSAAIASSTLVNEDRRRHSILMFCRFTL